MISMNNFNLLKLKHARAIHKQKQILKLYYALNSFINMKFFGSLKMKLSQSLFVGKIYNLIVSYFLFVMFKCLTPVVKMNLKAFPGKIQHCLTYNERTNNIHPLANTDL